MIKTLHFQCRGCGLDSWLGNEDPSCYVVQPIHKYFLKRVWALPEVKSMDGGAET